MGFQRAATFKSSAFKCYFCFVALCVIKIIKKKLFSSEGPKKNSNVFSSTCKPNRGRSQLPVLLQKASLEVVWNFWIRNCDREIFSSVFRDSSPFFQYSIRSSSVYASLGRGKEVNLTPCLLRQGGATGTSYTSLGVNRPYLWQAVLSLRVTKMAQGGGRRQRSVITNTDTYSFPAPKNRSENPGESG